MWDKLVGYSSQAVNSGVAISALGCCCVSDFVLCACVVREDRGRVGVGMGSVCALSLIHI